MRRALALLLLASCHDKHEGANKKGAEGSHDRGTTGREITAPTPAQHFLQTFFASTCDEREKMIRFPEHNRSELRAFLPCAPDTKHQPLALCNTYVHDTTECWIGAGFDNDVVLAPQPGGGYLLDLRASMRWPTLTAVAAQMPLTPAIVRVMGQLSTYFNYEFNGKAATHYSIELVDRVHVYAYVAKDSADGRALYTLLSDALFHTMTLAVRYPPTRHSSQIAIVDRFLTSGYDETEAEHEYEADAAAQK